jgi:hypothetical protein
MSAIEQIAAIREWRSAVMNAVQHGYPVTEDWFESFRAQSEQASRLALNY